MMERKTANHHIEMTLRLFSDGLGKVTFNGLARVVSLIQARYGFGQHPLKGIIGKVESNVPFKLTLTQSAERHRTISTSHIQDLEGVIMVSNCLVDRSP